MKKVVYTEFQTKLPFRRKWVYILYITLLAILCVGLIVLIGNIFLQKDILDLFEWMKAVLIVSIVMYFFLRQTSQNIKVYDDGRLFLPGFWKPIKVNDIVSLTPCALYRNTISMKMEVNKNNKTKIHYLSLHENEEQIFINALLKINPSIGVNNPGNL